MNVRKCFAGLGFDVGGTSTEVVCLALTETGLTVQSVAEYKTAAYASLATAFGAQVMPVLGKRWPAEFQFVLIAAAGLPDKDGVTHFCYPGGRLAWGDLRTVVEVAGLTFGYGNDAEVLGISVGDWAVMLKPAEVLLRCDLLREVPEILTSRESRAAFRRGIERQPTRTELALEVPVQLVTIENAHLIGMGVFAAKKWRPDLLACV